MDPNDKFCKRFFVNNYQRGIYGIVNREKLKCIQTNL